MCTIFGGQGYKPSKIYVDDFLPVESESTENKDLAVRYGIAINGSSYRRQYNGLF